MRHSNGLRIVLLLGFLVPLSIGQAGTVSAGINVWTSNGPVGGSNTALAIDPVTPTTLHAGMNGGGVFRSANGSEEWSAVNTGLTDTIVPALVIDPGTPATRDFSQLPLYFVENGGQADPRVDFYVQGSDKTIYFSPGGVTFALMNVELRLSDDKHPVAHSQVATPRVQSPMPDFRYQRWAVKLDFVGANRSVRPVGQGQTEATISYFKGSKDQWHAGLPTYSRIVYPDLWPGIDLVYFGTVNRLKYEFIVQPGADPAQIRLAYRGADVSLNAKGQLLVATPAGAFADDTPVAYQEIDGQRVRVEAAYNLSPDPFPATRGEMPASPSPAALEGREAEDRVDEGVLYSFDMGSYDPTHPLILDPAVLVYCGYVGGNSGDPGHGIAVDTTGNAYVTGYTLSTEASFPVTGGPDLTFNNGEWDAFVAKINAAGSGLVYAGYIGGDGVEQGHAIAVDGAGNAYVIGYTNSTQVSFPVTGGPDLSYNGGTYDAFVAKVNAAGTGLVYAGYLGGNGRDWGYGIALDGQGNAYVTGLTESTEASFPVTGGPDLTFNGECDAFVAKVSAAGTGLAYAGYIGGNGRDYGKGIAVDGGGNAYVAGGVTSTESSFPVTVGPDLTYNGDYSDAFVAKVGVTGSGLDYCGYIGGNDNDAGYGIEVDGKGNAHVTGHTGSTEASFPVTGGPDLTHNGSYHDAFVAKVNEAGTGLVYAGYIGGNADDFGLGIALDGTGNAYVTGYTNSTEASFPVISGPDLTYNGGDVFGDAFVAKVNVAGTGLAYAGYIGGNGDDAGWGIAVDDAGNAYVTGRTGSTEASFPVTGGPDLTLNGGGDAFVAKISGAYSIYLPLILRNH